MSTKEIQQALLDAGFDPGPIDGIMGPRTRAAISAFQTANGLTVDGVVGTDTALALDGLQKIDVDDSSLAGGTATFEDVQGLFDQFNLTAATGRESSAERINRLVEQINSGESTLESISTSLSRFAAESVDVNTIQAIFDDLGLTSSAERNQRIADEVNAGERDLADVRLSLSRFSTVVPGAEPPSAVEEDVSPGEEATGSTETIPGILSGGEVLKVNRADQADLWFMAFESPAGSGNFHLYQFESLDQLKAQLGDDFATSGTFTVRQESEDFLQDSTVNILGQASELAGLEGNYNGLIQDTIFEVALDAGIRDPGILGQFLNDPEIQLILAQGTIGSFSDARIQADIRNTDFYQNTLYPGISKFLQEGVSNPEAVWKQYTANVSESLRVLGVQPDADGSFRQTIGSMLSSGISDTEFTTFAPVFIRAAQSPEYADALNLWVQRDLGREITFEDVFNVLNDTSDVELASAVESANIQFQAERAGVDIDRSLISVLTSTTDFTEAQIAANFTTSEQRMLALGDSGLKRAGLTQQALIMSAFGNTGLIDGKEVSAAEVTQRASKFALELGLEDDPKAQLFVGFTPEGTPTRPGLAALSPEGA